MDDARLSRAMKLSVAEGGLATVMGSLIGGVFLTGFALAMGANQLQIGILAALPVFANLAQLLGAVIIERTGRSKPLCVATSLASRLLWLPAVLVPLWIFPARNGDAVWWMIVAIGASSILSAIGGVAWLVWTKDLIPAPSRVAFFGRRNFCNAGLSLIMGMAGAFFLDYSRSQSVESVFGFLTVFSVAISCGLVGWELLRRIPDSNARKDRREPMINLWRAPLQDRNFRSLVTFYSCWNFAVHLAQPFFAVYMLETLGLPFVWVTGFATVSSILGLLTNNLWSRWCDRFGTKPVVAIATCCDVLTPLLWLFVTPGEFILPLLIHCLGIINAPLAMGPNNLLLSVAPPKNASPYLAIFNAVIGTMTAIAAIVGGSIATLLANQSWVVGPVTFEGLKTIFLISMIGRMISVLMLARVSEPDSDTVTFVLKSLRTPKAAPQPAVARKKAA